MAAGRELTTICRIYEYMYIIVIITLFVKDLPRIYFSSEGIRHVIIYNKLLLVSKLY